MADTNMNQNKQNEMNKNESKTDSMNREQGQGGQFDKKPEQGSDKSAIGGGESAKASDSQPKSETGEPGRARNELDENKSRSETTNR